MPIDGLLSKAYAKQWQERIDLGLATPGMPEPGDAWAFSARQEGSPNRWKYPNPSEGD